MVSRDVCSFSWCVGIVRKKFESDLLDEKILLLILNVNFKQLRFLCRFVLVVSLIDVILWYYFT
jgi:hypothetical protein